MFATRIVFAVLLLAPAAASAETLAKTWTRSFPAGDHPRVRVTTADARVEVHAVRGKTIDAHVELNGHVTGLYLGRITPKVRIERREDGLVDIEARLTGGVGGITIMSQRLIVEVSVPPACDLEIHTSDGPVSVEGVHGQIQVSSSDGRLTLHDVGGDIRLHTSDGAVLADGLDGRLDGTTSDGALRIRGRFDDLELESSDGRLTVEVESGSKMTEDWNLSTSDGGLDLTLPRALKATLDARVRDGHLDLDLPGRNLEESSHHDVRLDLNGGGPVIRVRSGDGSVRIRGGA
jgi:hypothetical protein